MPEDIRRREYVVAIIKNVYEKYGFEPLETPAVENIETLLGKYGEEGNQLIFKILARGEAAAAGKTDLALRYDLTVPTARVIANSKNDLPRIFKRYQIQPVWRADRPARGRYREFYQCDVDVFGSRSMVVEAELCCAVTDALEKLGFADFVVRLNHRQILRGILDAAGIAAELQTDALTALDKLDKIGANNVRNELLARKISENAADSLLTFVADINEQIANAARNDLDSQEKINARLLSRTLEFIGDNANGANGVDELQQILRYLSKSKVSKYLRIDPSLARGLSYYTGAIVEINVPDLAGSICGGGRYDDLIGMFSGAEIPACGFSLGLERIILIMTERAMFPPELVTTPADVLVTVWNAETIADSLGLANELRQQDLRATIYPEADKLGKQFKYAAGLKVPFVATVGDEERANNTVALKNLTTGEQEIVARAEVAAKIKKSETRTK